MDLDDIEAGPPIRGTGGNFSANINRHKELSEQLHLASRGSVTEYLKTVKSSDSFPQRQRAEARLKLIPPKLTTYIPGAFPLPPIYKDIWARETCTTILECRHQCSKPGCLGINCRRICTQIVPVNPRCGHADYTYCTRATVPAECLKYCLKEHICGHLCRKQCHVNVPCTDYCGDTYCTSLYEKRRKDGRK